jgi:hypothetical protein
MVLPVGQRTGDDRRNGDWRRQDERRADSDRRWERGTPDLEE